MELLFFTAFLLKLVNSLNPLSVGDELADENTDPTENMSDPIMWKREIHQCLLFANDDSWELGALSQRLDAAQVRPRTILNYNKLENKHDNKDEKIKFTIARHFVACCTWKKVIKNRCPRLLVWWKNYRNYLFLFTSSLTSTISLSIYLKDSKRKWTWMSLYLKCNQTH